MPANADVPPPRPEPPPPGPTAAQIRSISVEREWLTTRWAVLIKRCAAGNSACRQAKLIGCWIVGVDGKHIAGGDIAALVAAAAGAGPIKLMLEHCNAQSDVVPR